MPQSNITIGKLANLSDVSVETIRYYQKIDLFEEPEKPLNGYRLYTSDHIRQLKFIKKAQRLGFSLQEVAELLDIDSGKCSDVQAKALLKRDQISQQITELKTLETTLNELINACAHSSETHHCPIIESLSDSNPIEEQ